jgi:hypothetical protein
MWVCCIVGGWFCVMHTLFLVVSEVTSPTKNYDISRLTYKIENDGD